MKNRSLSLGGRPGPLRPAAQSQFSPSVSIPGCEIAPRSIKSLRADIAQLADCGLQQESQSKHPFLPRSGQPCSSQSQRSLSQGCLTQSQDTLQFSQNSQPEEYGCDQWTRLGFHEKEISLSQPKPPSPYFAGLTSSLNRRNSSGTVGGGSTPASSTCTSSALCLVGPQSSTPRPWPQCNVSEELEKRLGSLEKFREVETALLQKICDDYQEIKTFLEETCFESKDSRSKLALQQNALHKLLKEEEAANSSILSAIKTSTEAIPQDIVRNLETANSSILSAIKTSVEAILQDIIRNLKAAEEAQVANKSIVSASVERMMESVREEIVNFKRDLKAEIHEMKQPVSVESVCEEIMNFKRDLKDVLHDVKQCVPIRGTHPQLPNQLLPITDMHNQRPNQPSDSRLDLPESTPKHSSDQPSLPISLPEVVDLDELPDPDLPNQSPLPTLMSNIVDLDELPDSDFDTELPCLARDDTYPANKLDFVKTRNRLKERIKLTDEYIHKSVRGKMLRGRKIIGLQAIIEDYIGSRDVDNMKFYEYCFNRCISKESSLWWYVLRREYAHRQIRRDVMKYMHKVPADRLKRRNITVELYKKPA